MIHLDGSSLTLADLVAVAEGFAPVALAAPARVRVAAARRVVDDFADRDTPTYGINTGFGSFAEVRVPHESLSALQVNLLRSHAAGVGEPLPEAAVRATMALRANVLAKGYSGIRLETLELLLELLNRRVHPVVPSRGSVGASGDLAPLAHLALVLIGEGEAWHEQGRQDGASALARVGLTPAALAPKEGLALINGTQASTALLGLALHAAERARACRRHRARRSASTACRARPARSTRASTRLAASTASGRRRPTCGAARRQRHQRRARQLRPRAGRLLDALRAAGARRRPRRRWRSRIASSTSRPTPPPTTRWCSPTSGEIVSGGNFHGAPVAMAADLLCIAVTQLATISERRSERLVNPALSGLPAFLTRHGGLQSGLMMAQVTAAALTSELKTLAHPASVDTIPTSANKEDHVSMSMSAALKARRAVDLARHVVAIEVLCACQAIDLLAPLTSSPPLARVHERIRQQVSTLEDDRSTSADINAIAAIIASGELERACAMKVN